VELLKWFKDTAAEIEAREKQRLAAEMREEIKNAEDADEEDLIRNYYGALLGRASADIRRKLKLLGGIHRAQPDVALEDVGGVPPLPNKERLKDWYEVDLIDSYFDIHQKQKLQRFHEVVGQEINRILGHINPEDHLKKHMEYESFTAANEQARQKANESYLLHLDALDMWRNPGPCPEDQELRWKDAVSLKFLRANGGNVPRTRSELYSQIEDLDLDDEYQQHLANEQYTRSQALLADYRTRHPHSAINAYFNHVEQLLEIGYDEINAIVDYTESFREQVQARGEALREDITRMYDVTMEEVLAQHPEWEAEIRFNIQNHRWDQSIPASRYEHDWAEHEKRLKIWWEPMGHHKH